MQPIIIYSNMSIIQQEINVDNIINKLIDKHWNTKKIDEREIRSVCIKAREVFLEQPMLLELEAPVKVCGDIHGQYADLLRVFQYGGWPGDSNYLFIGDYVDRGKNSIECMMLLLCYKIKYPQNFFVLRGNHQNSSINRIYGFYDECKRRYNLKIWKYFLDVFNVMPVVALIDEKIICMHGGLSPSLTQLADIQNIQRPIEVPDQGLLCDLLWSDPNPDISGWGENERGVSFTFGQDVVQTFLAKFDIDLVCRAHQVVEQGYEFSWKRKLVTVFTAPNYCGQFQNNGAFMNVDQNLICSFHILRAVRKMK